MGASDIVISPPSDLGNTVTTFTYLPGSGSSNNQFQPFTTSGDGSCDTYTISYTLSSSRTNADTTVDDYSLVMPTYDFSTSLPSFTLLSTDNTYLGILDCVFTASLPFGFPTSNTASFSVTFLDKCEGNTITAPSTITPQTYKVNDGVETITLDAFTFLFGDCTDTTYEFEFTAYDQATV